MKALLIALSLFSASLALAQTTTSEAEADAVTESAASGPIQRIVSVDAFDLAYSGGFAFSETEGENSDVDANVFRLNLNYAQSLEGYDGMMWKGQLNFNREDIDYGAADSFYSSYGIAGGVLMNFTPDDIKNSFMAEVMAGIERAYVQEAGDSDDEAGFNLNFKLEGGKRFDLGRYSVANISYAPTLSYLYTRYGGDIRKEYYKNKGELRINFLKFDVIF